jgi:hypothetical protein
MSSILNPFASSFIPSISEIDIELLTTAIAEPDLSVMQYPFSFILDVNDKDEYLKDYNAFDFSEGLLGEEKINPGCFPNNISKYYWIHQGENDEEPWMLLCKLENKEDNDDIYAFYTAWCDYTGFDCQGGMKLIVSKDIKRLFYEGLTDSQRTLCIKEKKEMINGAGASKYVYEEYKHPIPVPPVPNPERATRAFIKIWNDGKELILNLDNVNGLEMEVLEEAIGGLTAKFLTPIGTKKPKKKYYTVNICAGTSVYGIDDDFKRRFGNPNKKWELRLKTYGGGIYIRKWGKVEVSFILY